MRPEWSESDGDGADVPHLVLDFPADPEVLHGQLVMERPDTPHREGAVCRLAALNYPRAILMDLTLEDLGKIRRWIEEHFPDA